MHLSRYIYLALFIEICDIATVVLWGKQNLSVCSSFDLSNSHSRQHKSYISLIRCDLLSINWSRMLLLYAHYSDFLMGPLASQITSLTIVYSTVHSGADQRKYKCSASLAFVWGIHRWPVNSPHKWPETRKCFYLVTSSCWWFVYEYRRHDMETFPYYRPFLRAWCVRCY